MKSYIFALAACLTPALAQAAVPSTLTVQGVLRDASGALQTQSLDLEVNLYPSQTSMSAVYTQSFVAVAARGGVFALELPITDTTIFSVPLWIEVTIQGTPDEVLPRFALASVPYAFYAQTAGSATAISGVTTSNILQTTQVQLPLTFSSGQLTLSRQGCPTNGVWTFDGTNWNCVVATTGGGTTYSAAVGGGLTAAANGSNVAFSIADLGVTTARLADLGVTSAKIADLGVTTGKLANDAVTATQLAAGAVRTRNLFDLEVTTGKIQDSGITNAKLAVDAVRTTNIQDGAVTSLKLATGAVGATAIATGAVGSTALATGAVSSTAIADGTIVDADVATNAAIAFSKLSGVAAASHTHGDSDLSGNVALRNTNNTFTGVGTFTAVGTAVDVTDTLSAGTLVSSAIEAPATQDLALHAADGPVTLASGTGSSVTITQTGVTLGTAAIPLDLRVPTTVDVGVASGSTGALRLSHASHANVTSVQSHPTATASINYQLPAAGGTVGDVLSVENAAASTNRLKWKSPPDVQEASDTTNATWNMNTYALMTGMTLTLSPGFKYLVSFSATVFNSNNSNETFVILVQGGTTQARTERSATSVNGTDRVPIAFQTAVDLTALASPVTIEVHWKASANTSTVLARTFTAVRL